MENKYLLFGDKKECNGCGICTFVCPKNCIKMEEDEEGFLYPKIDKKFCIHCNKCKNICSNINKDIQFKGECYGAINKSEEERKMSSSGGMFYILAKYVIEKQGVVFGVEYDENLMAIHDYAENIEDCKKFCGSKYVRSNINDSYRKVKKFLEQGRYVLFTGTPCQNQALKIFLDKEYDKLILCDIICHANPSPKIFRMYIENLEKIYGRKIIDVKFRSKENGWHNRTPIIEFDNHKKIEEDTFSEAFARELVNRPSCNNCKFVSFNRQTDFTIADFWKVEQVFKNLDDDKGISLILVNTQKAKQIFKDIKEMMDVKQVDKETALKLNHYKNVKENINRKNFFRKIKKRNITSNNIIENLKKYYSNGTYTRLKKLIRRLISGD